MRSHAARPRPAAKGPAVIWGAAASSVTVDKAPPAPEVAEDTASPASEVTEETALPAESVTDETPSESSEATLLVTDASASLIDELI
jgi:hypothetical protein